ncbi:YidH family protein [Salinisphaera aquimarina]|uniref:YidH family protein n=1 Tax=Salinisphaera aquimarina TaxID=2094031 RepID=A0ABV7EPM7_9GAMM
MKVEKSNPQKNPEHEPDYRFTLANERTFLAWIRTALALLAGAVAIVHLAPEFTVPGARKLLAGVLAVISIASVAGSALRWHGSQKAMRCDAPLPSTLMPWLLALGVVVVGLLVLVLTTVFGDT